MGKQGEPVGQWLMHMLRSHVGNWRCLL